LIFELVQKNVKPIDKEFKYCLTKKIITKLSEIPGGWGSESRDSEKTYPGSGSRGQKAPDPDPQHW